MTDTNPSPYLFYPTTTSQTHEYETKPRPKNTLSQTSHTPKLSLSHSYCHGKCKCSTFRNSRRVFKQKYLYGSRWEQLKPIFYSSRKDLVLVVDEWSNQNVMEKRTENVDVANLCAWTFSSNPLSDLWRNQVENMMHRNDDTSSSDDETTTETMVGKQVLDVFT